VANGVGLLALAGLAAVTVADVAGRYALNRPVLGALELSEFLMVLLTFACLAPTELQNGHVAVDVVVDRFPPRARALAEGLAALLGAGFWGLIAWRTALQAARAYAAGETTSNLLLPVAPLVWTAAAGSALFALALLARALEALGRRRQP
jgi:TRAP-type C4-dicarboxylate transport system permease small subunit